MRRRLKVAACISGLASKAVREGARHMREERWGDEAIAMVADAKVALGGDVDATKRLAAYFAPEGDDSRGIGYRRDQGVGR